MNKIIWKIQLIIYSALDVFKLIPVRFKRIGRHTITGIINIRMIFRPKRNSVDFWEKVFQWWLEFFFFLVEVCGIPELYDSIGNLIKWRNRPMNEYELSFAKTVFGDSLNLHRVVIDENAYIGCKRWQFCYVSFFTINAWGKIAPSLLLHELMHVWQFRHFGAVYIPRALNAQSSFEGYDYGGAKGLYAAKESGKTIWDFNYEQQAEIVRDYFDLCFGNHLAIGVNDLKEISTIYQHFVFQIRDF